MGTDTLNPEDPSWLYSTGSAMMMILVVVVSDEERFFVLVPWASWITFTLLANYPRISQFFDVLRYTLNLFCFKASDSTAHPSSPYFISFSIQGDLYPLRARPMRALFYLQSRYTSQRSRVRSKPSCPILYCISSIPKTGSGYSEAQRHILSESLSSKRTTIMCRYYRQTQSFVTCWKIWLQLLLPRCFD